MELILKSDNESKLAKVIALAKKLNISIEQRNESSQNIAQNQELINHILHFKAKGPSSFGDAASWEREQREDRHLPFSN